MKVGDIVTVNENGIRRLIVESRDEIVPRNGGWFGPMDLHARTVYRLAGNEYSDRWFSQHDISTWIKR